MTHFKPGDEVFGETMCGFVFGNGGAFAEYVSVPEENLALKPANVTGCATQKWRLPRFLFLLPLS